MGRWDKLNAVPASKQRPLPGIPQSVHLSIRDNVWTSMRLGHNRVLFLNRVAGYGLGRGLSLAYCGLM